MYEPKAKEELIKVIPLTDFTELRITNINDEATDIRQWFHTQKDPELRPSKSGIRLKNEFLPELIEVLKEQI